MVALLKTGISSIKKISEGQTVTLDADGVLTVTWQIVLTAVTCKFGSYASNHNTTPDGVSGTFSLMVLMMSRTRITADIDKNTTGAKTELLISYLLRHWT